MSAGKFTPGPWAFYDDSNDGKTNRIEIVAIGKTIARIYHSVPAEDLPNARLIAAAPLMYEGLRNIVRQHDAYMASVAHLADAMRADPLGEAVEAARAVLAAATGEA
jgi:hypothetical protein